jgi:polysaccharide biosynthesis protein PelA
MAAVLPKGDVPLLRKISIPLVLILAFGIVFSPTSAVTSSSNPIASAQNYLVLYSNVSALNLAAVESYDLAILEPSGISSSMLTELKKSDTLLFAYVSALEVESYDSLKLSLLVESDYLHIDGVKQFNSSWNCYSGDARSTHYQDAMIEVVRQRVVEKGYDGVFFDTLDDLESIADATTRSELTSAYRAFLARVKATWPDLLIIQNRAFELYKSGSAASVDGLMYEDVQYQDFATSQWYRNFAADLVRIAGLNDDVILAVSHENAQTNYEFCRDKGWLYYYCPTSNNYMKIETTKYNVDVPGPAASQPTATPTPRPTATPSPKPTATPSPKPTVTPSPRPTATPSPRPTATPSSTPTTAPTPRPTAAPTLAPKTPPTRKPTVTPNRKPMATPTPTTTAVSSTSTPWVRSLQIQTESGFPTGVSAIPMLMGHGIGRMSTGDSDRLGLLSNDMKKSVGGNSGWSPWTSFLYERKETPCFQGGNPSFRLGFLGSFFHSNLNRVLDTLGLL